MSLPAIWPNQYPISPATAWHFIWGQSHDGLRHPTRMANRLLFGWDMAAAFSGVVVAAPRWEIPDGWGWPDFEFDYVPRPITVAHPKE